MPKTKTTGFVITVTFLPAPLHTPGDGVRVCTAWADVPREQGGVTSLQKVGFLLGWRKRKSQMFRTTEGFWALFRCDGLS